MDPNSVFPRLEIGRWPTPVGRLERVSQALGQEIWAKTEEACGAWGGNKVRKLEYIIAAARERRAQTLVTYGAGSSSWAASVALHGSERGFRIVLGLGGAIPRQYRELYARTETAVFSFGSYSLTPLAAARAVVAAGPRAMRLPAGGSDRRGDLGSMNAGREIAHALAAGTLPQPRFVYVPAGTSGTAAGIATGLAVEGSEVPVVAVRVTPRPLGTAISVRRHARTLMRLLATKGAVGKEMRPARVIGDGRFFAPAYGVGNIPSEEAIAIAAEDGLMLDPTYAAKAFAALIADVRAGRQGPLLFLHTSPGPLPQNRPVN